MTTWSARLVWPLARALPRVHGSVSRASQSWPLGDGGYSPAMYLILLSWWGHHPLVGSVGRSTQRGIAEPVMKPHFAASRG
jgi:hypothetical protein